jgi:cyclohexyl-isocyanide hydratase
MHVVAPLFPDVTQLDLTGPLQVLSRLPGSQISLPWHDLDPVRTDAGFSILPTTTFAQAPPADLLLIPGGRGAFALLEDPVVLDFVRAQAAGVRYLTSVCTGAFVLGAAGLLQGKRATTHWASHPLLELLGAIPVEQRVVRDGTLLTGGGVTSGIDLALTVAAEICGEEVARGIQLALEYDPQPPFDAGSPGRPGADQGLVEESRVAARRDRGPVVERAAARLTTS